MKSSIGRLLHRSVELGLDCGFKCIKTGKASGKVMILFPILLCQTEQQSYYGLDLSLDYYFNKLAW